MLQKHYCDVASMWLQYDCNDIHAIFGGLWVVLIDGYVTIGVAWKQRDSVVYKQIEFVTSTQWSGSTVYVLGMSAKTCHEFVTPCQRKTYEYHRARVKSATSVVDVIPPKIRPHIKHDAKKKQLESERQDKIIRDNFILLKNLEAIMHKKKKKKKKN